MCIGSFFISRINLLVFILCLNSDWHVIDFTAYNLNWLRGKSHTKFITQTVCKMQNAKRKTKRKEENPKNFLKISSQRSNGNRNWNGNEKNNIVYSNSHLSLTSWHPIYVSLLHFFLLFLLLDIVKAIKIELAYNIIRYESKSNRRMKFLGHKNPKWNEINVRDLFRSQTHNEPPIQYKVIQMKLIIKNYDKRT